MASCPSQIPVSGQTIPYQVLSQSFHFTDDNELQWWQGSAPLLSKQLLCSQYDVHLQYKFLTFFREYIIPALGPIPQNFEGSDFVELQWKGVHLTGLNLEFGYNVSHAMVRLAMEPVGVLAGTEQDPFNTAAIWAFLQRLCHAPMASRFEMQRFYQFAKHLIASEEEISVAMGAEADPKVFLQRVGPRRTQTLIGMDLHKNGTAMGKGYLYPQIKSIITGIPVKQLLFNAVRKSDPEGTLSTQLTNLERYLSTRQPTGEHSMGTLSLTLLGCDLIAPAVSRTKLYCIDEQVDWETVEGIWMFNGQRKSSDTLTGLKLLRQLWQLLPINEGFCPAGMDLYAVIGAKASSIRCPMMVHYNLRPGLVFPEPQVYIPTFGVKDMEILDALTIFFESQGWSDLARYYKSNFLAAYPNEDFSEAKHICAWISFAYKDGGAYMSLYNHSFEPVGEIDQT